MIDQKYFLSETRLKKLLSTVNNNELLKQNLKLNIECRYDNGYKDLKEKTNEEFLDDDDSLFISNEPKNTKIKNKVVNVFTRALLLCRNTDKVLIGSTQDHALVQNVNGYSSTISTSNMGLPHIIYFKKSDNPEIYVEDLETNERYEITIRKMTPKECFRLMGVIDDDIEKIQKSGLCETGQLHMAGNSIVVDCMTHIFKNIFTNHKPTQIF